MVPCEVVSLYFPMAFFEKIYMYQKSLSLCKSKLHHLSKTFNLATMATMAELPHGKIFFPVVDISVGETGLSFPLKWTHKFLKLK